MTGPAAARELARGIDTGRLADELWSLVTVASPTRQEARVALRYAELLAASGAAVEVDRSIPESPSVIGRLDGGHPGPTLQLAGHLDHIDVPHAAPTRSPAAIGGRGAADMKGGLAAILAVVRRFAGLRGGFPGRLLVTAYGLHEAPLGHAEGLVGLIDRGVKGDAALVMEGPPAITVVCGKGQSIWTLRLARQGVSCHELRRSPHDDGLLDAATALARALREEDGRLARQEHRFSLLGPESIFVGQLHYGDFYNRSPVSAMLQGTRRWHPDKGYDEVRDDFARLVARTALPRGISVEPAWTFVGESFSVDPAERIVRCFREATRLLEGAPYPLGGVSSILDTSRLVPLGGVPTVPIDCGGATAHADAEAVGLDDVARGAARALLTAELYLAGHREEAPA